MSAPDPELAHVDRLLPVAVQLVERIRRDDTAGAGRWLAETVPDRDDWWRLALVLAALAADC